MKETSWDKIIDEWVSICETLQISLNSVSRWDGFIRDRDTLFKQLDVKNYEEFKEKINNLIKEGWTIEYIKDFFQIS